MDSTELLALLQDTAIGDRASFARLYQQTSPNIYAVCLKLLQRRELAEEAMQDTFIRVWHNAADYQSGRGTVLAWMTTIARYRSLDMIRRKNIRKEQGLLDKDVIEGAQPVADSDNELSERLEHCMNALTDEQRQAIQLVYFNGLSHNEAVTHIRSPLGTIKSWIRRGLQSLKQCLSI
ncbi:sigma-70 family RNA polymerase sigma factor [Alteromonas ponticola]|uniref:Sigma-70 family RNA polymerase sigma factor n=1 Tax=Alteromonas ponticola TaxID=2720613 RepID=A0ABX1R4M3_9ALTE|nr:sigma-70 family RNA polymerase sigma factor [Alteromonas ponticola]NMH60052.1 sigma-70 family RNA polymerase sigma factor [Alteromonas ponticola]